MANERTATAQRARWRARIVLMSKRLAPGFFGDQAAARRATVLAMSSPTGMTALLLVLSCAHARAPDRPATSPDFSTFVDDYFASRFAYAPTRATRVGFHEYDDKLEDLSRERIESQVADLKTFQARLSAIDRSRLSFDDAIDAQLIDNGIRAALLELTVVRGWQRNPMLYAGLPGNAIDSYVVGIKLHTAGWTVEQGAKLFV